MGRIFKTMNCGAVIVDSRAIPFGVIEGHEEFLPPDWGMLHLNNFVIREIHDYNRLLGSVYFWELIPFDKVLIFQADSGLLRNGIEEFLEYDYVGAPFQFQDHGGNGGLSLRTKSVMLEVIKQFPYDVSVHGNEDVYFSNHVEKVGGKLAPREVCEKFSVESIFKLGTLGHHAIDKYHSKENVNKILNQYENIK